MRRLVLIAVAFAAAPAAVSAQNQPDAGIPGAINGITTSEVVRSYGMDAATVSPGEVLAQLKRVCASDRRYDRQRCAAGWRIINEAHAKLKAERAKPS